MVGRGKIAAVVGDGAVGLCGVIAARGVGAEQIIEGRIRPGRVFDRVTNLDGVPDGYRAMNAREAIKVMITF